MNHERVMRRGIWRDEGASVGFRGRVSQVRILPGPLPEGSSLPCLRGLASYSDSACLPRKRFLLPPSYRPARAGTARAPPHPSRKGAAYREGNGAWPERASQEGRRAPALSTKKFLRRPGRNLDAFTYLHKNYPYNKLGQRTYGNWETLTFG